MLSPALVLLINVISTWYLVGLIWTIQVVHYRQFDLVGESNWFDYHAKHTAGITWIVAPAMLIELESSIALIAYRPAMVSAGVSWTGVALVVAIWLSTAFLQVPIHNRLAKAFDADACRSLTKGNWARTFLWSARGVIMAYAMARVIGVL